jgi:hypothetical protein
MAKVIVEAVTDQQGKLIVPDHIKFPAGKRVLITLVDAIDEITLLSEEALEDWNRPEEDAAWSHLQQER